MGFSLWVRVTIGSLSHSFNSKHSKAVWREPCVGAGLCEPQNTMGAGSQSRSIRAPHLLGEARSSWLGLSRARGLLGSPGRSLPQEGSEALLVDLRGCSWRAMRPGLYLRWSDRARSILWKALQVSCRRSGGIPAQEITNSPVREGDVCGLGDHPSPGLPRSRADKWTSSTLAPQQAGLFLLLTLAELSSL